MKTIQVFIRPGHFKKGAWIGSRSLHIYPDEDAESPRSAFDNFGTMICFHQRYSLGDKHGLDPGDFTGWGALEKFLVEELGADIVLPLYLYDHSGLRISTVGFIYCTEDEIIEAFGDNSPESRERAWNILKSEVEVYDEYLTGNVFGYFLEDDDLGDTIDSCWGFYGQESIDYIVNDLGFGEVPA